MRYSRDPSTLFTCIVTCLLIFLVADIVRRLVT